ncbi:MAG: OmpH family outer membrane protein [Planctomycetes bacterium]|nr:OmpH family outer membrane protein [Planctomycetota bacterium]
MNSAKNIFLALFFITFGVIVSQIQFQSAFAFGEANETEPASQSKSPNGEFKIAFVNLRTVWDNYPAKALVEEEFQVWYERQIREIQEFKRQSEEFATAATFEPIGSRSRQDLLIKSMNAEIKRQVKERMLPTEAEQRKKREFRNLYHGILDKIEKVAHDLGYNTVLKVDSPEALSGEYSELQTYIAEINFRGVLIYDSDNDITAQVIAALKEE